MPSYPHLTPSAAPTPDASPTKEGALEAAAEEEEAPPSASTAGAAEALAAEVAADAVAGGLAADESRSMAPVPSFLSSVLPAFLPSFASPREPTEDRPRPSHVRREEEDTMVEAVGEVEEAMEEAVTRMEALVDTAEDAAETAGMAVTVAEEMVEQAAASQSPPETEPPHRWDPAAVRPPWRPTVAEQILEQRASPEGALSPSTTPPPPPPAPAAPLAFPSPPPQTSVGMCGFLSAHAASSGAAPSASDRSPQRRSRDFPTPPPRAAPPPPAAAPVAVAPPSASIPPPPRQPRQPRRREAQQPRPPRTEAEAVAAMGLAPGGAPLAVPPTPPPRVARAPLAPAGAREVAGGGEPRARRRRGAEARRFDVRTMLLVIAFTLLSLAAALEMMVAYRHVTAAASPMPMVAVRRRPANLFELLFSPLVAIWRFITGANRRAPAVPRLTM